MTHNFDIYFVTLNGLVNVTSKSFSIDPMTPGTPLNSDFHPSKYLPGNCNSLFSCRKTHFIYLKMKFNCLKSNINCLKLDFSFLNLRLKRCGFRSGPDPHSPTCRLGPSEGHQHTFRGQRTLGGGGGGKIPAMDVRSLSPAESVALIR